MKTTKVWRKTVEKKVMLINRSCASSTLQFSVGRRKRKKLSSMKKVSKFIQFPFFSAASPPTRNGGKRFLFFPFSCRKKNSQGKKFEIFSHFAAGLCATNVLVFCDGENEKKMKMSSRFSWQSLDFNCWNRQRKKNMWKN